MLKKHIIKFTIILNILLFGCSNKYIFDHSQNLEHTLKEFHNSNSSTILVAAHRAQHTKYPENSLAAIQHSIENNIDIIEIDVRRTKDGKLVLLHDSKIDRTTNGKGEIEKLTFDETQKFNLINSDSSDLVQKIPLLKEVLEIAKDKIMIDIDIKGAPVKKLYETALKTNTLAQIIFFDSEFEVLDSLLILDSTINVMPRAHSKDEVEMIINKYHPKVIHVDPSFYNKEIENLIKNNNSRIWINALGEPDNQAAENNFDGYNKLKNSGANIFQTDLPVLLKKYLHKNENVTISLN
ncbi:MAG: glycerophosphodiester phosphodiesterase family protein [Ignavibacteriales bacterium]|nr:glycerophosphodiester phosphodiesterase family protein [Ignavibacteriales bacterium]